VLCTIGRSAMPPVPAVGARTRGTISDTAPGHGGRPPHRPAFSPGRHRSRCTPGKRWNHVHGNAFGSAAYLAELLSICASAALSQITNPPPKRP